MDYIEVPIPGPVLAALKAVFKPQQQFTLPGRDGLVIRNYFLTADSFSVPPKDGS
jgi:hypothetical protein